MRKLLIPLLAISLTSIGLTNVANAKAEPWGSCSQLEQKKIFDKKPYHCIKTARGNFVFVPASLPNGSAIDQGAATKLIVDKNVEPLVAQAYKSFDLKACKGSHENLSANYLPAPDYPQDKLGKQKTLFERAMSCYNSYFDKKIVINIALASENDIDFLSSLKFNDGPLLDSGQIGWSKWMMTRISKGGFSGSAGWSKPQNAGWVIMLDSTKSSQPDMHGAGHEFVHILQSYSKSKLFETWGDGSSPATYQNVPCWFWEGTAELFSTASLADSVNNFSAVMSVARSEAAGIPSMNKISNEDQMISTLKSLEAPSNQDANMMFYALGKQLSEYILANYGYEKYKQIMKNAGTYSDFSENLKNTIGVDKETLYKNAAPWLVGHWKLAKF